MVYCKKCGKKNKDDAKFCTKCGAPIKVQKEDKKHEKKVEGIAEDVKEIGEKVGKKIEQTAQAFGKEAGELGKRIEKRFDSAGKGFEGWYDRNFGVFGPLVSSFLGLIILRIIIMVMDFAADGVPILTEVSRFLYTYLLLFFVLILLSSYGSYFSRRYKKQFRWFSPVFSAIGFVIFLWLAAKFLIILNGSLDIPVLETIASFIETYLIMIFVFVLFVGYIVLMFMVSIERNSKQ